MVEHKSHKVRITNLPSDRLIYRTTSKSIPLVVTSISANVFLLIMLENEYRYLSFIFGFIGLMELLKKDKPIFEGTKRYFVIYDKDDEVYADIIYLNELANWQYAGGFLHPNIDVNLKDGEVIKIDSGVDSTMKHYFKRIAKKQMVA